MIRIGLVGSNSFVLNYQKSEFQKFDIKLIAFSNLTEIKEDNDYILNKINGIDLLFFEKMDSLHLPSVHQYIKNGIHILIDHNELDSNLLQSLLHIANEANVKCILLNNILYYHLFEPVILELSQPIFIEIIINDKSKNAPFLKEKLFNILYENIQNISPFISNDVKQLLVNHQKIFSGHTDFISIYLEILNRCHININLALLNNEKSNIVKIFQSNAIYTFDLINHSIMKTINLNNSIESQQIKIPSMDINEKKISHFMQMFSNSKIHTDSLFQHIFSINLSKQICKKIFSEQ